MIRVRVEDFQSIHCAELEIDGFTVLTGTNNAGKSALFRALRGAFTNARGTGFVRQGGTKCTVALDFGDGKSLVWEKGRDGTNDYVVNGVRFKKVGHGVPEEVRALGIQPIVVNNTEYWPQLAPQIVGVSFLLDQPGSVVAEAVADVGRVDTLNQALRASESDKRGARANLKVRVADGKRLLEKRAAFDSLGVALDLVAALEAKVAAGRTLGETKALVERQANRLRAARTDVESLAGTDTLRVPSEEQVAEAVALSRSGRQLRSLRERCRASRELAQSLSSLDSVGGLLPREALVDRAGKLKLALRVTRGLTQRYVDARRDALAASTEHAQLAAVKVGSELVEQARKLSRAAGNACHLVNRLRAVRQEVGDLDRQIARVKHECDRLQSNLKTLVDGKATCPLCGSSIVSRECT